MKVNKQFSILFKLSVESVNIQDILILKILKKDYLIISIDPNLFLKLLKTDVLFINLLTSTVIQGIPNHWEFRVSGRNLLKKY